MPSALAARWSLDPAVVYLNHGSYGACPVAVQEAQAELRRELEAEPVDFLSRRLQPRMDAAREELSAFLGADPADLAFVPNATTGVNAVLRSLDFGPGDELLTTSHAYAACRKTLDFVAARSGATVVVAALPFPCPSDDAVVDAVLASVTPHTRLALLDHVTSPTAMVLPLRRLVDGLRERGVETLVDGAHAPGMVALELDALGAAYYTGNAHKWLCAPKGSAFLHARRDRQAGLHPLVTSHGSGRGFHAEFDWTGTVDPSPWLCIPEALRTVGAMLPGGWPAVMAANRELALGMRGLLCERFGLPAPCPGSMVVAMAALPLPAADSGSPAARLDPDALAAWFRERGVEGWFYHHPVPVMRLSAQRYNTLDDAARFADLLEEALRGG
ncbi:MAG: aminotransferase class V-fold PLP-dependent enzyme [Holophagaceae bacterium]